MGRFVPFRCDEILIFLCSLILLYYTFIPASDWISFLYTWQTLISGLSALIAACITIFFMQKNERDKVFRRSLVSRAKMNDALSSLISYIKECHLYICNETHTLPPSPSGAIEVFKDSLEYIDIKSAKNILKLIQFYQVYNARLVVTNPKVCKDDILWDTMIIYTYLSQTFSFARQEIEKLSDFTVNQETLHSASLSLTSNTNVISYKYDLEKIINKRFSQ